jgi:hypothetical protein
MRLSLGGAYAQGVSSSTQEKICQANGDCLLAGIDAAMTGGAFAGDLTVGYEVASGVVIGGEVMAYSGTFKAEASHGPRSFEASNMATSVITIAGPSTNVFLWGPHGPYLHVAGGVAVTYIGEMRVGPDFTVGSKTAGGFGLIGGLGMGIELGSKWALAWEGCVIFSSTNNPVQHQSTGQTVNWNHRLLAPALMMNLTYY